MVLDARPDTVTVWSFTSVVCVAADVLVLTGVLVLRYTTPFASSFVDHLIVAPVCVGVITIFESIGATVSVVVLLLFPEKFFAIPKSLLTSRMSKLKASQKMRSF